MIELNLKYDDSYLINMSKVCSINGFLDADGCWTINVNFVCNNDIYIYLSDEDEFRYVMNKFRNEID